MVIDWDLFYFSEILLITFLSYISLKSNEDAKRTVKGSSNSIEDIHVDNLTTMNEEHTIKLPGNTLVKTKPKLHFSFSSHTNSMQPFQDNYIDTIIFR